MTTPEQLGRKAGFLASSLVFGAIFYFVASKLGIFPEAFSLPEMLAAMVALNVVYHAARSLR